MKKQIFHASFTGLILIFLFAGCQTNLEIFPESVEGFKCDSDSLCDGELYCINGSCRSIDDPTKEKRDVWCETKDDCPAPEEQVCSDGICRYSCETSGCPSGFECNADNNCIPVGDDDDLDANDDDDNNDNDTDDDDNDDNDTDDDDNGCEEECSFPNAFADCRDGECVITRCAPGFRDTNGVKDDGCEYMCTEDDKGQGEICDHVDNDCDGVVDNVYPQPSTIEHCGICFEECAKVANSTPVCLVNKCLLECNPGFEDTDGNYDNGCEDGVCTPTGDEICDGKDNDCNGEIDDGDLCAGEQVCIGGVCKDKCKDKCYPPNSKGCDGNKIVTCQETEDGCLDFVVTEECTGDTHCDAGKCVEGCVDECTAIGETGCDGETTVVTCDDRNGDTCLEWGDPQTCPAGSICQGGKCIEQCENDCTVPNEKICEGNGIRTCGNWDDDPCLEWSSIASCGENQTCENGVCKDPSCSNECEIGGSRRCYGDILQRCKPDWDDDPCLEWGDEENCLDSNRLCDSSNPACFSGCADGYSEGYASNGNMFACKGAWDEPGLNQSHVHCDREAGDDSAARPEGNGCTVQDLCAEGFHVCLDRHEVNLHGGCNGLVNLEDGFWAVRQKSASYGSGNYTINCEPQPEQPNNFFGCGNAGRQPGDTSCYPLTQVAVNSCAEDMEEQSWYCPDSSQEYDVVTHGKGLGGVVCCVD